MSLATASVCRARVIFPPDLESDNAKILLILCTFFHPNRPIPLDIFSLGVLPQNRWKENGEVSKHNIRNAFADEVLAVCTPRESLDSAVDELKRIGLASVCKYGRLTLDQRLCGSIRMILCSEHHRFWEQQVLLLTYRNIALDSLGYRHDDIAAIVLQLDHAALFQETIKERLPEHIRKDFCLALLEILPPVNSEVAHVGVAQLVSYADGITDRHLQIMVKIVEMAQFRLTGRSALAHGVSRQLSSYLESPILTEKVNAAVGLAVLQEADYTARSGRLREIFAICERWRPINPNNPSLMEALVCIRLGVLQGRIHRFLGSFRQSLDILNGLYRYWSLIEHLYAHDDFRLLVSETASTLRELGELEVAERGLRYAIERKRFLDLPGECILEVSLAEVLFAQGRITECTDLCDSLQERKKFHSSEIFRILVTLGKIHYTVTEGYPYWYEASLYLPQDTVAFATRKMVSFAAVSCPKTELQKLHEGELAMAELTIEDIEDQDFGNLALYSVPGLFRFIEDIGYSDLLRPKGDDESGIINHGHS